jgi:hypothetical protein
MRALTLSLAAALLFSTSALASEPAWLHQADTNNDGFVTPAEAQILDQGLKVASAYPMLTYRVIVPRTTVATYTYALSPPVAFVAPGTTFVAPRIAFVAPQPYVMRGYVLSDMD